MTRTSHRLHPTPSGVALALLALALLATGCSSSDEYFPTGPGVHWLYNVEYTTMDGVFAKRYPLRSADTRPFGTERVTPHESVNGRRVFYAAREDGVYRVAHQRHGRAEVVPYLKPGLVLPAPGSDTTEWTGHVVTQALEHTGPPQETLFQIRESVPMRFALAEQDATVTTTAGTFRGCRKVVGSGTVNADVGNYIGRLTINVETVDWYAPGIGLVRSERTERTNAEAINYGRVVVDLASVSRS